LAGNEGGDDIIRKEGGGGPPDATRPKGSRSIAIELVDVAVQEYPVHEMALLLTPVISSFNRTFG